MSANNSLYYKHTGATVLERNELKKRKEQIQNGQNVEPITQNGFYYHMRRIFLAKGAMGQGRSFRRNMTNKINDLCKELHTTREDLKIYASSRAFLYFKRERIPVSLATMKENIEKGTDIIIIEKEGICEVLFEYADKVGIALLDTKGFVVQYAKMLSELSDSNIAMITDLDDSGLLMAEDVMDTISGVYRIGIDFDMINKLRLNLTDVEERYTPGNAIIRLGHIYDLKKIRQREYGLGQTRQMIDDNLRFVKNKRVEIDSIMNAVGASTFWKYVIKRLAKQFPERDYNRSLTIPDNIKPTIHWNFVNMLNAKVKEVLKDDIKKIRDDLRTYKGIIKDVDKKQQQIYDDLQDLVDMSTDLEPLRVRIQEIIDEFQVKKD